MKYFLSLTVGLFFTQTANAYDCNQLRQYIEMSLSGHELMTSTLVEHLANNPQDGDTQLRFMTAIDQELEKASKWASIYTAMCK